MEKKRIEIFRQLGIYPRGTTLGDAIEKYGERGSELFDLRQHLSSIEVGDKRGQWTVVKIIKKKDSINALEFLCRCRCGKELVKTRSAFTSLKPRSCCSECYRSLVSFRYW